MAGYFGDLGDGIHKGDVNDPRVSAIEVTPEEIHYWHATSGTVSRTAQVAVSAVTGKTAAPGELRTITKAEVSLWHDHREDSTLTGELVTHRSSSRRAFIRSKWVRI